MKRCILIILTGLALASCGTKPTGAQAEGPAWLFTGKGPYPLNTTVNLTGPAYNHLLNGLWLDGVRHMNRTRGDRDDVAV